MTIHLLDAMLWETCCHFSSNLSNSMFKYCSSEWEYSFTNVIVYKKFENNSLYNKTIELSLYYLLLKNL